MAGVPAAPPPAQPCRGPAPCHGSFLPASPSSCTQLRSGLLRSPAGEAAPPRAAPPSAALVGSALVPSLLPSGTGAASPHTGEVRCLRPNATRLCGTTTPQDGADPQPRLHNAPGCEAAPPAPQGGSKPRTAQRWGRHGGLHGVLHSHGSTGLQPGPAPLAEPLESLRAARPRQALICPSMRKTACRYRLAGKGGAGSSSEGLRSRRKELRAARSRGTDASQL